MSQTNFDPTVLGGVPDWYADDWPQGTPDQKYRARLSAAEQQFREVILFWHDEWEASIVGAKHIAHPCCPAEPSFAFRNHGEFVVNVADSLASFAGKALTAEALLMVEQGLPTHQALSTIKQRAAELTEESRRLKWLPILDEAGLGTDTIPHGWESTIGAVFDLEVLPAVDRHVQACVELILEGPDEPLDAVSVSPNRKIRVALDTEQARMADEFLTRCAAFHDGSLYKTMIWRLAGHTTRETFQQWQRGELAKNSEADRTFRRICQSDPQTAISQWQLLKAR